jgi:hypothetical protein
VRRVIRRYERVAVNGAKLLVVRTDPTWFVQLQRRIGSPGAVLLVFTVVYLIAFSAIPFDE